MHASGLLTVNLVSSPGSGKTAFLQRTLRTLRETGVPVKQINTDGRCHLEAQMISDHLANWDLETARANIEAVRPGMQILTVSAKSGTGMSEWLACLAQQKQVRGVLMS